MTDRVRIVWRAGNGPIMRLYPVSMQPALADWGLTIRYGIGQARGGVLGGAYYTLGYTMYRISTGEEEQRLQRYLQLYIILLLYSFENNY